MNASIDWDGKMGFTAVGDSGHPVQINVGSEHGNSDAGPKPMELLLFALGSCSGVDVVSILQKMNFKLDSVKIEIQGTRAEGFPKKFTGIHMVFKISGADLKLERLNHAVDLSLAKYCSVAGSLNATITYEVLMG